MKAEYYEIHGQKTKIENDAPVYENISFKVKCTSHTQHIPSKTHLNGVSKSGIDKIRKACADGYFLTVCVGGRFVGIENK